MGLAGPLEPAIGLPLGVTRLLPNAPNPFNPSTPIRFDLAEPGRLRVAIYGPTGRLVRNLLSNH